MSLVQECRSEGGYRIHAISVNPTEGRKETLYFPALAEAGGGRAVTAAEDRIAEEIFVTLLPHEAREKLLGLPEFFRSAQLPEE